MVIALLAVIVGSVVIFTLQNLAPITLVILGMQTQALPLAIWVVGALLAGGLTSLFLAGLPRSAAARPGPRSQSGFSTGPRPTWGNGPTRRTAPRENAAGFSATSESTRRAVDDWEASPREEWDDWEEPKSAPRRTAPASRTDIRDTADDDWSNWEGYEDQPPTRRTSGSAPRSAPDQTESAPPRTNFEVPQSPTAQQQSGSVYSYSYRDRDPVRDPVRDREDTPIKRKANQVYDAEYRVLIPPFNPSSPPTSPPPPASPPSPPEPPVARQDLDDDDDDWGLDDDLEDKTDRPRSL